jgi:hypothetical protein
MPSLSAQTEKAFLASPPLRCDVHPPGVKPPHSSGKPSLPEDQNMATPLCLTMSSIVLAFCS